MLSFPYAAPNKPVESNLAITDKISIGVSCTLKRKRIVSYDNPRFRIKERKECHW